MMPEFRHIPDLTALGTSAPDERLAEERRRFIVGRSSLRRLIAESQGNGRLPDRVADELVSSGILRLLLPREFGGLEIDPASVLLILEELAWASGSLGWTAMVACETPILLSLLPRSTFEAIYANGPDVYLASSSIPAGQAREACGGWRVTGSWPFVTGNAHCHWVLAHSRTSTGAVIATLHPREDVTFLDDWNSLGLRATSSGGVRLEDAFVTGSYAFQVETSRPCFSTSMMAAPPSEHFSLHMAAVAVGIVRHALDIASMTSRGDISSKRKFEDVALFDALGEAVALTKVARPALRETMLGMHNGLARTDGETYPTAPTSLAVARYIVDQCLKSVDAVFALSGSAVVFEGNELQECACDLRCIAQHANLSPGRFAQLGAYLINRVHTEIIETKEQKA